MDVVMGVQSMYGTILHNLNPAAPSEEVHLLRISRTFKNKSARNVQIE